LVTERKEFPQAPNCPPSIETATLEPEPTFPLRSVIKLDLSEEPSDDAGPVDPTLTFSFQVRDCNEDETLQAKVFSTLRGGSLTEFIIEPQNRNPAEFTLNRSDFAGAVGTCQNIELLISERFRFGTDREPEVPGDLGTATWWVAVYDTENPSVEMVICD